MVNESVDNTNSKLKWPLNCLDVIDHDHINNNNTVFNWKANETTANYPMMIELIWQKNSKQKWNEPIDLNNKLKNCLDMV